MENDIIKSKKKVLLYTLPILISSILEEAIILSDSILLSFKNPIYLSTVGIIDSIYLLLLVLGESLNNAFQNYYARNINNISIIGSIFKPSILIFFFISLLFSLLIIASLKFLPPQLIGVEHYDILYTCRWYLVFLVIVTYISLSFNSILIGLGKIKGLGYISVVSIISNILLGIFLLYVWDLKINPCVVVLISSIVSECIAIILMILLIFKSQLYKEIFKVKTKHSKRILKIITESSIYLCGSDLVFNCGSILLYIFCLYNFPNNMTAVFTLLMAYWGVIQVPAESFSETALNLFSYIHVNKYKNNYYKVKSNILTLASLLILLFGIFLLIFDYIAYDHSIVELIAILVIMFLSLLNLRIEIISVGLFVRLKTDSYLFSKLIYGVSVVILISFFYLFTNIHYIHIFVSFLISMLISLTYLRVKERNVWKNE